MKFISILAIFGVLICAQASANDGMREDALQETASFCLSAGDQAYSAVELRDKGFSKEEVAKQLGKIDKAMKVFYDAAGGDPKIPTAYSIMSEIAVDLAFDPNFPGITRENAKLFMLEDCVRNMAESE